MNWTHCIKELCELGDKKQPIDACVLKEINILNYSQGQNRLSNKFKNYSAIKCFI